MPGVLVIPGDGAGVEVTEASLPVLKSLGEKNGIEFATETAFPGECCIDTHGIPVTEETTEKGKQDEV